MNDSLGHLTTVYGQIHPSYAKNPGYVAQVSRAGLTQTSQKFDIMSCSHRELSDGSASAQIVLGESRDSTIVFPGGRFIKETSSCSPTKTGILAAEHFVSELKGEVKKAEHMRVPVALDRLGEARSVPYETDAVLFPMIGPKFTVLLVGVPKIREGNLDYVIGFMRELSEGYMEHSEEFPFVPKGSTTPEGLTVIHASPRRLCDYHSYDESDENRGTATITMEDFEGVDLEYKLRQIIAGLRPKETHLIGPSVPIELRVPVLAR